MKCRLCDRDQWKTIFAYDEPDKYEEWVGLQGFHREWRKCSGCGLYQQDRNYPLSELEKIYKDGYRAFGFRGETIKEAFDRLMALPDDKSENVARVNWLIETWGCPPTLLDIGSGIGVFPGLMSKKGAHVYCVETNKDSINFLNDMELSCFDEIPKFKTDMVSLVHVLEHMDNPGNILGEVREVLKPNGTLFIEVPDVMEFSVLHREHDEFNSCHTMFFDMGTLHNILLKNSFIVTDMHKMFYPERKLSRILALCQAV